MAAEGLAELVRRGRAAQGAKRGVAVRDEWRCTRVMTLPAKVLVALLCGALPTIASAQSLAPALEPFQEMQKQGVESPAQIDPDSLWNLVVILSRWRDQQVFDVAAVAAADKSAPEIVRAAAIVMLGAQADNYLVYYSGNDNVSGPALLTVPLDPFCAPGIGFLDQDEGPTPLGPDYQRDAATILDPIAVDSSESTLIRRLADCARPIAREIPPQIDISSVELVYQCENRFLVTNPTERMLPFRYEIQGTDESINFLVLAESEESLVPEAIGTLVLYYDGEPFAQATSTGTPCSP